MNAKRLNVLVACEYSGRVREAFAALGHNAMSCDLLPTEVPGNHYQGDVRDVLYENWDMMIAHPPCTRLTNSGVRWLHVPPTGKSKQQMWDDLDSAAEFYKLLRDAPIAKKAIENPIMHCYSNRVRAYWAARLIPTNKLVPPEKGTQEYKAWSQVHMASPGPDRWKERSRTYPGIADAMALQWGGDVRHLNLREAV